MMLALYITWYDRPDENARNYNHYGCTRWIVPLDDMPEPADGETRECPECAAELPLKHDALHEETRLS